MQAFGWFYYSAQNGEWVIDAVYAPYDRPPAGSSEAISDAVAAARRTSRVGHICAIVFDNGSINKQIATLAEHSRVKTIIQQRDGDSQWFEVWFERTVMSVTSASLILWGRE